MELLYAFTEYHSDYPAFINLSKDDQGRHVLRLRSQGNGGRDQAHMTVSPDTLRALAAAIEAAIVKPKF